MVFSHLGISPLEIFEVFKYHFDAVAIFNEKLHFSAFLRTINNFFLLFSCFFFYRQEREGEESKEEIEKLKKDISDLKKQFDSKKSDLNKQRQLTSSASDVKNEVNNLQKEIEALKKQLKVGMMMQWRQSNNGSFLSPFTQ